MSDTGLGVRFAHVDALRAVAVMLVVVAHAGLGNVVPGGSGVTIFFSISGFVITWHAILEREKTGRFAVGSFYFRRLVKLGPPFLIFVLIPTLLWACFRRLDWPAFAAQTLFVYNWVKASGAQVLPGSQVVWSLSIEEQFYIIFSLVWALAVSTGRWKLVVCVLASCAVLASTVARFIRAGEAERIYYGTDTRLDGIAWGVLVAFLLKAALSGQGRSRRLVGALTRDSAAVAAAVLFVGTLSVRDDYFRDTMRFTLQSLATCALIIYGFGTNQTRLRRSWDRVVAIGAVQTIGLASYSIYLAHLTVAGFLLWALPPAALPIQVLLLITAGVLVGVLAYLLIEQPTQAWRRRRLGRADARRFTSMRVRRRTSSVAGTHP